MVYRCYSSEEQLKLVRVGVFGVGFCGETFEIGNFGGNLKLEFSLDIMVESFEECPTRLLRGQNILA
jgi:hypothetical protein